ncbi:hypothetical protein ACNKHL_13605 [Shigella flexneri]
MKGADLNPLLQDPGHFPFASALYMGYVGFLGLVFAFAIALVVRASDSTYARFYRPWTLAAWIS